MKLKITALAAGALVLALGAYKFSVFTHAEPNCCGNKTSGPPITTPTPEPLKVQEFVPYMFLFQHLANVKDNPSVIGEFQRKSKLPDSEFKKLIQVASDYHDEVSAFDAQAQVIIDNYHAQYPPGNLSEVPPPPPQELLDLQEKRNAAALTYRDRLKTELGGDFPHFTTFVDSEITAKLAAPGNMNPNGFQALKGVK